MQVNLTIEDESAKRLEKIAVKTRRSKGAMVAYLIDRYWERMRQVEKIRRHGSPSQIEPVSKDTGHLIEVER